MCFPVKCLKNIYERLLLISFFLNVQLRFISFDFLYFLNCFDWFQKKLGCTFKHPFSRFPRKFSWRTFSPPLIYTFPVISGETSPKINFKEKILGLPETTEH